MFFFFFAVMATSDYICSSSLPFFFLRAVSLSQSFEEDGPSNDGDRGRIQRAASAIINALSKRHNSTVMLAVVEVKVETQVESPPIGESHDQLFLTPPYRATC